MSLWLRIKWWLEEQKAKLPGWLLIGWPIFWSLYTGIPDLFDATNFWIEKAKTVSGKIGLSAAIIDSPWFNLGLFILGVLYLRYVGEVQRPLRHPAWPILGWAVVVIVALTFWSVLVAGYVATHVHQQGVGEAKAQIDSLTQTNQQLQQKVAALEQQALPRVLTDEQKKKFVDALTKVPPGVTYRLTVHAIANCVECSVYTNDLGDVWKKAPGWQVNGTTNHGLDPRLKGVIVAVDIEGCPPEELSLAASALDAAGIKYTTARAQGILGSGTCAVVVGGKPQEQVNIHGGN